jgi:hypothetical protein
VKRPKSAYIMAKSAQSKKSKVLLEGHGNFKPYEVPNAAKVSTEGHAIGKQVSFKAK